MTGILPPLMPIPPPLRYVYCSGAETKESKQLTEEWRLRSAEIAEENEERRRHNQMLRDEGHI